MGADLWVKWYLSPCAGESCMLSHHDLMQVLKWLSAILWFYTGFPELDRGTYGHAVDKAGLLWTRIHLSNLRITYEPRLETLKPEHPWKKPCP